jgi:hypothetical protein
MLPLLWIFLAVPEVVFTTIRDGSDEHVPADKLERLAEANGAHLADCKAEDAAWVTYDLGGPDGEETIVASFRDGVGVFGKKGALHGRFVDESLPCGAAADVVELGIVRVAGAPPAALLVVRDDAGRQREVADHVMLVVFAGDEVRLAWTGTVADGERFEVGKLKWDAKRQKFVAPAAAK